jgi:ATP-dependent Clp endopeptidase proteolytic subunit ClpP
LAKKIGIKGVIIKNEHKWAYNWLGWDATCPKDISSVLDDINGTDDIIIEMNSPGGSVIPAHEIYTAIASYNGNVEIHVVGMAGSAASEILMACKSLISPVAQIMIHNCSTDASGDYRVMDSASQMLQSINQGIRNAYIAKTGLNDDKLKELMDRTTWMSAQEALEYGFVDGIMTFNKVSDPASSVTNVSLNNPIESSNFLRYLSAEDINKLQSVVNQNEIKNINNGNIKPVEQPNNIAEQQACILNKNNNLGGNTMTLEELMNEHPELVNEISQIKVTAKAEGVSEERQRLQAIDNIANSIPKELVNKAKYTEVMNASDLALKMITDSAVKGQQYLKDAIDDSKASGVDGVPATPSDPNNEDEDDALVNIAAEAANSKRKVGN